MDVFPAAHLESKTSMDVLERLFGARAWPAMAPVSAQAIPALPISPGGRESSRVVEHKGMADRRVWNRR